MKTKYFIYVIIAFVVILTGSHIMFQVRISRSDKLHYQNIANLRDTINEYQTVIKGLKVNVAEKNSIILSQKDAIKANLIEKEQLKKLNIKSLNSLTELRAYISVLRDSVSTDAIIVYVDSTKALKLPFTFRDSTEYVYLKGRFNYDAVMSYSLSLPIDLNVYVGVDKKGVSKAVVTSTNPYVKINDILSIKTDISRPSRFGIGLFGGVGVTMKGLQPIIGVGVTYSLIRF